MPQIEMTREELYELVWSKPMGEVAAGMPMSQVSLKKLCVKHHVPLPPLGYWKKSRASRSTGTIPLPLIAVGDHRIWVKRFLKRRPATIPLTAERPSGQNCTQWHQCTRTTERALQQATPDRRGALIARGVGVASINVAPETVDRALGVLDDLIRAIEKLGHSISTTSFPAALVINGEHVPVAVFETFERNDEEPDDAETMRRKSYELKYPKYVQFMEFENGWRHRPSGKLTIILGDSSDHGLQRIWADNATHDVEGRIGEVAAEAVAHAEAIRSRRERIELKVAERRESEERRQRDATAGEQQSKRVAFFKERAGRFDEAESLARFLRHLRHTVEADRSQKMRAFLRWADAYVEELEQSCGAAAIDADLADGELW